MNSGPASLHAGTFGIAEQNVRQVPIGAVVSPKREAIRQAILEAASPRLQATTTDVPNTLASGHDGSVVAACCALDPLPV